MASKSESQLRAQSARRRKAADRFVKRVKRQQGRAKQLVKNLNLQIRRLDKELGAWRNKTTCPK